jgi:hypothetical protein
MLAIGAAELMLPDCMAIVAYVRVDAKQAGLIAAL